MGKEKMFYVYELLDSRTDEVFYIGKGTGDRLNNHVNKVKRNLLPHGNIKLYNRIAEILDSGNTVKAIKIFISTDYKLCFDIEARLIYEYGFSQLCNLVNSVGAYKTTHYESFLEYAHTEKDREVRSFLFDYNVNYKNIKKEVLSFKKEFKPKKESRKSKLRREISTYELKVKEDKKKWKDKIDSIDMNRSVFDEVVL